MQSIIQKFFCASYGIPRHYIPQLWCHGFIICRGEAIPAQQTNLTKPVLCQNNTVPLQMQPWGPTLVTEAETTWESPAYEPLHSSHSQRNSANLFCHQEASPWQMTLHTLAIICRLWKLTCRLFS